MKQFYILSCMLAFLATSAQNTSVKIISQQSGQVLNGTTDTIYGDGAIPDVARYYNAVMESQDSMLVGLKRLELSTISGTNDYYCWYICYTPVAAGSKPVWYADDSLWMFMNDTVANMSVYLQPKGKMGVASYRYIFYPENNPMDSSWFDALFNIATVGIDEVRKIEVKIYPNPTGESVTVDIPNELQGMNLQMEVLDVSGRMAYNQTILTGSNQIDLPKSLNSGSYIVRIISGDRLLSNKHLVIR